jgi:hypothetical protein
VLPREERRRQKPKKGSRATGRKSWHQRLSLKQNKKEEKNEMFIPTMPAIEEEELLAVVEVENTMLPEVEKTILPETEVTTRGDDKVSQFEQVVVFHPFKHWDHFTNSLYSQFLCYVFESQLMITRTSAR